MVDVNRCKMLYDGNEDEYAEYYDYSSANEEAGALALADSDLSAAAGYELVLSGADGAQDKILGSRELSRCGYHHFDASHCFGVALVLNKLVVLLASTPPELCSTYTALVALRTRLLLIQQYFGRRYYKQRPRPEDTRRSVAMASMVARYRALGVTTAQSVDPQQVAAKAIAHKVALRQKRMDLGLLLKSTVNRNLPKNCPY